MGTNLTRTPASAVTAERRKFTYSCWIKKCENGKTANEFVFVRDAHRHGNKNETHFHSHIINDEPHSHIN